MDTQAQFAEISKKVSDTHDAVLLLTEAMQGMNDQLGTLAEAIIVIAEGDQSSADSEFHDLMVRIGMNLETIAEHMASLPDRVETAVAQGVRSANV